MKCRFGGVDEWTIGLPDAGVGKGCRSRSDSAGERTLNKRVQALEAPIGMVAAAHLRLPFSWLGVAWCRGRHWLQMPPSLPVPTHAAVSLVERWPCRARRVRGRRACRGGRSVEAFHASMFVIVIVSLPSSVCVWVSSSICRSVCSHTVAIDWEVSSPEGPHCRTMRQSCFRRQPSACDGPESGRGGVRGRYVRMRALAWRTPKFGKC